MAGNGGLDRRAGAAKRHAGGVKLELQFEQFGGELRRSAYARIGDADFRRIGPDVVYQLLHRLHRHVGMHDHDVRRSRGECDRREILVRVVRVLGVEARIDDVAR